ncbi:hypothetical protein [Aeromonas jandaei]|uniref:hypothetical protein n=1 Tax=Aeromonas jandaei TaxID=650 RepID=UPI003D2281D2
MVTDYANAMLAGIQEGESNSKNFSWLGDIYMQSGRDWTPAGIILNENVAKIRTDELNSTWNSQGLSQEKIQELSLRDNIINSVLTTADTNGIYNLLDNGASGEEIIQFAAGAAFTKAITRNTLKQPYEPNKGAVGNMGEFFKNSGFGGQIKNTTQKSNQQYQGQSVYKATDDIGEYIKKGDQFYPDGQHKNHLEVFDKRGNFRVVLNLDGTINEAKTKAAEGRKLK